LALLYDWVALHAFAAPAEPLGMRFRADVSGIALAEHFAQEALEIAVDGQIGLDGGFVKLAASTSTWILKACRAKDCQL